MRPQWPASALPSWPWRIERSIGFAPIWSLLEFPITRSAWKGVTMKFAIVKSSELGRANRWDAPFHVLNAEHRGRAEELARTVTLDDVSKLLRGLTPAQRQSLLPLGRGQNPKISRIIAEYPYLALAIIEANPDEIAADIDRQIDELESKIALLRLRKTEVLARSSSVTVAADQVDHSAIGLQPGFRYPLLTPDRFDDEFGEGFAFALIPSDGMAGARIHDAWVVNERNQLHPGYSANAVPVLADDLDLTRAVPSEDPTPVGNPHGWGARL